MYSGRPREWFDNVLARCAYFLLLDLVRRKRAPDQELGDDGDAMRYAVGDERPRIAGSFDLAALDDRVLCWRTFHGGANDYDDSPMHFVALLRGSRRSAQPTLNRDVAKVIGLLEGGPMPVDQ